VFEVPLLLPVRNRRGARADVVKGALLDNQWRIHFATCECKGPAKPSHFSIADGPLTFHLCGCAGDGHPYWAEQHWEGIGFKKQCAERRLWRPEPAAPAQREPELLN
jgi:hypothetical protein